MPDNLWKQFQFDHYYAWNAADFNREEITHIIIGHRAFREVASQAEPGAIEFTLTDTRIFGLPVLRTSEVEGWLFMTEVKERRT